VFDTEPLKAKSSCAPALYAALGQQNLYGCWFADGDAQPASVLMPMTTVHVHALAHAHACGHDSEDSLLLLLLL